MWPLCTRSGPICEENGRNIELFINAIINQLDGNEGVARARARLGGVVSKLSVYFAICYGTLNI